MDQMNKHLGEKFKIKLTLLPKFNYRCSKNFKVLEVWIYKFMYNKLIITKWKCLWITHFLSIYNKFIIIKQKALSKKNSKPRSYKGRGLKFWLQKYFVFYIIQK